MSVGHDADLIAELPHQQPIAVVLDFVNPERPLRDGARDRWQGRGDKAGGGDYARGMVELVTTAATVLLGERGLSAHAEDVERIVQGGRLPLTVLMIERRGRDIAMAATVVALEAATIH